MIAKPRVRVGHANWTRVNTRLIPLIYDHYCEFLGHPGRSGVLHDERTKCYTRIINFWLLFLEASPDAKGPHYEECRRVVLANWSWILSKCVPGDKDLICLLRDFTLDKARKKDVERVIAWLEVSRVNRCESLTENIIKDVVYPRATRVFSLIHRPLFLLLTR